MTRQVALLYSNILSPSRRVTARDLLEVASHAGLRPVRTVLSTGNLVVDTDLPCAEVEERLETTAKAGFGRSIPVFVRSIAEWHALVAANPFPAETIADPTRVAVRIMRYPPSAEIVARIKTRSLPGDGFLAVGRTLWLASAFQLSASPLLRAAGGGLGR